ncbi:Mu-like prophage protein gp29 [Nitrosomonas aestuarii]|uniref:Mu-like prophage protein gp29 n=1 Tax=Nitrosomonas aestuarii TaxID=52441 RepID=A0A1I4DJ70_9PROT|nr:DUF935 family protein [Nitrosomonas aestuarii]SFK92477.1 Mu-like prophage protein gp29 [Nitrosomonas aestuarii]
MADKVEKPEFQEIATSRDGRDITRGWLTALMHAPVDDKILVERGGGDYKVYEEVLRDDNVRAGVNQRIYGVIAKPWEVKPGGDSTADEAAAEFIEAQINSIGFDKITLQMLHGTFYGFSVAEAIWARDGSKIVLGDIRVRNRRRFAFDGEGNLRLKTFNDIMPGERMPDRKFVVATFGADHHDAPYGLGLAHYLYWLVWLKRNVTRFWAVYLEKFGTPTALGKYPRNTNEDEQQKLLSALRAIQRDAAVVIPEGMEVNLIEALRSSAADHRQFIDQVNEGILLVCLGQSGTVKGTLGKLGGETEREAVKDAILKADSDMLSERFNRTIVTWLTEWNFPGAQPPTVYRVFSDEDLDTRIERDKKISEMGFRPTLKYIHETYGGEWVEASPTPRNNPDNLTQSDAKGNKQSAFAENDEIDHDPTSIDSQTDMLAGQSGKAGAVILDHVRKLVGEADTLEQLRDDLLAAYGDLDSSQLVNVMELAFIAADLSGRYDAQEEE